MPEGTPALDAGSRRWSLAVAGACLLPLLLQLPGPIAAVIAACALVIAVVSWRRPLSWWVRTVAAVLVVAAVFAQFDLRFGRDTGSALLGAMLALKPAETASLRDARSLVGFALFAPFSTFLLDQGPVSLALGLVAVVLALGALQRLAAFEGGMDAAPLAEPLRQSLRLLALGLPLAMAVFWLFPRIPSPLWGVPERVQGRTGLSDRMAPGDWLDLLTDDTVAARVRFSGPTPPREALYWRGPVLTDFDGRTWTRAGGFEGWPAPRVDSAPTRWTYELEVEPTDRRQLVALDLPLSTPEGMELTRDLSPHAMRPLAGLTRWRMTSAAAERFEPELRGAVRRRALALPPGFNPRSLALGRVLRRRYGGDDRAIVRHVLAWVRRDFAYSLSPPPLGRDGMDQFLFETRTGYCEHFAGAFTVLMRAAGIPTRVVTGYVGGYFNRLGGGYWMIRRSDAHAWTEVWLADTGWTRVDPTAAVAPENIYDTLQPATGGDGLLDVLAGRGGAALVGDWLRRNWNDMVLGFDASRQQRLFRPLGLDRAQPAQLVAAFALAAVLALGLMLALSLRAPREADPLLRAWHALGRRYARRGLGPAPHEPATTWAERIDKALPGGAAGLRDLAARFTRRRYAGDTQDGTSAKELVRRIRAHRLP
jgi:transglutaminase-like putative cysteine protease